MSKSLFTFCLIILSASAFAGEIELVGSKYGIPTGHIQVKEPKIRLNAYETYSIRADRYSAEVACDILNMDLVNYKTEFLNFEVKVIEFDSINDMTLGSATKQIISSLHCKTRETK